MSPHLPSPVPAERAALLRFEGAYERWRLAEATLAESEIRLWSETLRGGDAETCRRLAAETLVLRDAARAARQDVFVLLKQPSASP